MLLTAGAAVNQVDHRGRSPLYMAAFTGRAHAVAALLAAGADKEVQTPNGTPLEAARRSGHNNVVALLE